MMSVWEDLAERLANLLETSLFLKLLGGFLLWALGPWREGYGVLLALVVLDTLTGVWAARQEGRSIRSAVMKVRGLSKLFLYFTVLLLGGLVDRALGLGVLAFALGFLVVTEALSVVENLGRIAPEHPLWGRLRGILEGKQDRAQ